MVTQEINLNLVPGGVPPVVNVSQYDKGSRVLKLHLYLGTDEYQIPEGTMACIQGTKLDGTGFLYVCEWEGNTITADVTDQMTAVPGTVKCEAFLQEGTEKRIATANFVIVVERATLQDNDHLSETEIPLIGTLAEAALKAMASEKAAKTSEENAKDSEDKSKASENAAKNSQEASKASQDAAKQSEDNAKSSEEKSATSEKNAKASEMAAQKSAEAAAQSATDLDAAMNNARSYAVGGTGARDGEDTDNAKYYSQQAKAAKDDAEAAKNTAVESRDAAGQSEQNASASAKSASDSQSAASVSENNAKGSADKAAVSESNAKHSESNAAAYANQAVNAKKGIEDAENKAQSYAVGGTGTRTGEDTDNAKYYASEAKNSAQAGKNMDILEASGSVIEVENSAEAPIHQLVIEGRSSQKKYDGRNLLNLKTSTGTGAYGLKAEIDGDVLHLRGSYDHTTTHAAFTILLTKSDLYSDDSKIKWFPLDKTSPVPSVRWTTNAQTGSVAIDIVLEIGKTYDIPFQLMIYDGTEPAEYEPFVGVKPSPSADYPQEITSIGNLHLHVANRNLVDKKAESEISWAVAETDVLSVINTLPEGEYTLSAHSHIDRIVEKWTSETETAMGGHFNLQNAYDGNASVKVASAPPQLTRSEAVGYENDPYIIFTVNAKNKGRFNHLWVYGCGRHTKVDGAPNGPCGSATFSNWMLCRADKKMDYVKAANEHVEQDLGLELCSLPDGTHDEIRIAEDGSCTYVKRVGKIVFDGSDDEVIWKYDRYYYLLMPSRDYDGYQENDAVGFSNVSEYKFNYGENCLWIHPQSSGNYINKSCIVMGTELADNWTDTDALRSYLKTQPIIVYYKAKESAPVPLDFRIFLSSHNPYTVMWDEDEVPLTLQYYNVAVQGGQDQLKQVKESISSEVNRAITKEKEITDSTNKALDRTKLIYGVKNIAVGADLNAVHTPGEYVLPHASDGANVINSPVKTAFRLTVESQTTSDEYLVQTLRPYNSVQIYRRQTIDGGSSWSGWTRLAGMDDLKQSFGTLVTHQEYIVDNSGHLKYLTLFDITDWFTADSSTENIPTRSFTGLLFSDRGNGYISRNTVTRLRIGVSWQKTDKVDSLACLLETGDESYYPCIIHDGNSEKYYLAIRIHASSITIWLLGAFNGDYVGKQVLTTDSEGTMPDGWNEEKAYVPIIDGSTSAT